MNGSSLATPDRVRLSSANDLDDISSAGFYRQQEGLYPPRTVSGRLLVIAGWPAKDLERVKNSTKRSIKTPTRPEACTASDRKTEPVPRAVPADPCQHVSKEILPQTPSASQGLRMTCVYWDTPWKPSGIQAMVKGDHRPTRHMDTGMGRDTDRHISRRLFK
ncbi:hypothetical protein Bbelb_056490 [Branchiostoma belcheri]|nr:hypothetical protein Bbelb_056490 [Branchiostoma belcheri]